MEFLGTETDEDCELRWGMAKIIYIIYILIE